MKTQIAILTLLLSALAAFADPAFSQDRYAGAQDYDGAMEFSQAEYEVHAESDSRDDIHAAIKAVMPDLRDLRKGHGSNVWFARGFDAEGNQITAYVYTGVEV